MFTIKEILEATTGRLIRGSIDNRVSGVSIDSRTIRSHELFVAIRGRRFDGHNFIVQAGYRDAGAILFSDTSCKASLYSSKQLNSIPMIRVKDTIQALAALAHYHRERFRIPIIAITGSNGKTTTKDMLSAILRTKFDVLHNLGTKNNHIGVPLTILNLRKGHQCAVIEIGANHVGEIDRLSWVIRPTTGIITNIGPSHLKFFKNLEGVFKAKLELIKNLAPNGKIVINQDDMFLSQLKDCEFQVVTFGFNQLSNFSAKIIKQTKTRTTFLLNKKHHITLRVLGRHNVYNALASIACARSLGLSYDKIKSALMLFKAPPMRMQMYNVNNIRIINDCYNSNPGSLGCALDFLTDYSTSGKKIIVCGDMLELGRQAKKLHLNIGERIARSKIDFLITVGSLSRNFATGAYLAGMPQSLIYSCRNTAEAAKLLQRIIRKNDSVLIKGSRAMQMEKIAECFTTSYIR